jgi:5-methylcytosine-specific restriction endonuclease McrA
MGTNSTEIGCEEANDMANPVLLLDAGWRVDRVIGVELACELIVTGKAVAASEEIAQVMHSPSIEVAVPSVIARIGRLHAAQRRTPTCSPRRVRQRDLHVCQFVVDGAPCIRRGDSVDHLLPRSRGGGNGWLNLVAACRSHNHSKADLTFEEMRHRYGWELRRDPYVPSRIEVLAASIGNPRAEWEPFLAA